MSAVAQRWQLLTEGRCTICESEEEVCDCGLELAEGVRVRVCADCTANVASVLKLESIASEALGAAHRRELTARDQMLAERDAELVQLRAQVESQQVANEKLRAEAARSAVAVAAIRAAALELE